MKKKIISLFCVFAVMSGVASAAPIDSIEENVDTGEIIISGDFGSKSRFSIQVLKPGADISELNSVNNSNIDEMVETLMQRNTTDGKYAVDIPMGTDAKSGKYTVRINSDKLEAPEIRVFSWYKMSEIKEVFLQYKNSASASEIKSLMSLEENCNKLGISYLIVENLSSKDTEDVSNLLYDKKAEVNDVYALRNMFVTAAAVKAVGSASSNEAVIRIIDESALKLGIDGNDTYIAFCGKSNEIKNSVAERLRGKLIDDAGDLIKLLEESMFLADIEHAGGAADINKAIMGNKDLLSSAVNGYFSLVNTYNYDVELIGKKYNTVNEFETVLLTLLNKPKNNIKNGSGTGSGGSGAMISVPQPAVGSEEEVFDDLESAEWARTAIEALAEKKIVSGRGDKKFCPQDYVTREEFVKMAVGAFEITSEGDVPFNDVSTDAWYYQYVAAAYNKGLVKGISDIKFGTGTNITRQDMAVLIYRFMSEETELPQSGIVGFDDKIDISDYAREAVASLREAGIVSGMSEDMFMPKQNCTRAQVAYIIYKALKYAGMM